MKEVQGINNIKEKRYMDDQETINRTDLNVVSNRYYFDAYDGISSNFNYMI